jgi:hypothetical protein
MNNFCFIIPSYCETDLHGLQLRRCISSIRRWHDNLIVIIDDFSSIDVKEYTSNFQNIKILKSQIKGAGDMVTYLNFKNIEGFKNAVIFQDSMTLENPLDGVNDIDQVIPIWYFTNHRHHWSIIPEPETEYNLANGIEFHDDLMIDCIKKMILKEDFRDWAIGIYHQKEKWSGNIGCQSIIDRDFLSELDEKTGIIDLMASMNNNRLRRVAESLFPLACQFVIGDSIVNKGYDGLYYDGVNPQKGFATFKACDLELGEYQDTVQQVCKNKYFSKVTFNRRPQ